MTAPATTAPPLPLDADVAALPPGNGAHLAVVIDDVGGVDTYLSDYFALPVPLTVSVIPGLAHAPADDRAASQAGKEVILHIPLANRAARPAPEHGLATGATATDIDSWLDDALVRVPHAVGANNHEGAYGSTSVGLMRRLLAALHTRGLFFCDSVTSQRTVGYALEADQQMPPRINNVFLDHYETDGDSRDSLLRLARIAAGAGGAIGIGHVFHPYLFHAIRDIGPQLIARGYVFAPLSQVTNRPAADGLDRGVRATVR